MRIQDVRCVWLAGCLACSGACTQRQPLIVATVASEAPTTVETEAPGAAELDPHTKADPASSSGPADVPPPPLNDCSTNRDLERIQQWEAEREGRPATVPEVPARYVAGRVACGDTQCQSHTELCCPQDNGTGVCIPYTGERGDILALGQACQKQVGNVNEYPVACDDSSDCQPGQTCCNDPDHATCEPLNGNRNTCEAGEACLEGSPCRTPGTQCVSGVCSRPHPTNVKVPCEGMTCSGEKPICCGQASSGKCPQPARCVADAADCFILSPAIACAGPQDCPLHQYCLVFARKASCGAYHGGGNASLACRTAQDCPTGFNRPLKCAPHDEIPYLDVCQ